MKTTLGTILWLLLCATGTLAQSPVPAASGRTLNVSLGYSYFSLGPPPADRFGLNGADASFTLKILRRFGVKMDVGYGHTTNVLARGSSSEVLTYVGGPIFYPAIRRHYGVYVEGLVGGALVRSTLVPVGGPTQTAWGNHVSWAFGSGLELPLSSAFAMRFGGDYFHTSFFNTSLANHAQNDFRATASIVYRFGMR